MLTVLFSTRNGIGTLPRMLQALDRMARPDDLRIVAVDNGSRDGSGDLLREWSRRLPITVLVHETPGKNGALNFALDTIAPALADCELVVVTDDDIVPQEEWLLRLSRAARAQPRASVFGGTIAPVWPDEVPEWLHDLSAAFPILFATTEAAGGPCTSRDIYGPNMAVRGAVFASGVRFDARIGPNGSGKFGMGSESELLRRLERAGHRMQFVAQAIVGHQVKPSLLELDAVMRRARRYGVGLGMMAAQEGRRMALAARALPTVAAREVKAALSVLPPLARYRLRARFWREVERGRIEGLLFGARLAPMPAQPATAVVCAAPASEIAPVRA